MIRDRPVRFSAFFDVILSKRLLCIARILAGIAPLIAETALLGRLVYVPDIVFSNREHPDRSINIIDKKARFNWQDTRAGSRHELSHCRRLVHLIDVAIRHGEIVPPTRTLVILLVWALGPPRLARYMMDLIGVVSPSAQHWLLRTGWQLIDIFRTSSHYISSLPRTVSRGPKERRSTSCD
jgi:hypothetical protein